MFYSGTFFAAPTLSYMNYFAKKTNFPLFCRSNSIFPVLYFCFRPVKLLLDQHRNWFTDCWWCYGRWPWSSNCQCQSTSWRRSSPARVLGESGAGRCTACAHVSSHNCSLHTLLGTAVSYNASSSSNINVAHSIWGKYAIRFSFDWIWWKYMKIWRKT